MAINIADIITEYGQFYNNGGQNMQNLITQIMYGSETDQLFTLMPTENTQLRDAFVDINNVLQGYQDTFTHAGDPTFSPRTIDLNQLKIDIQQNPSKLEDSWLGFLAGPGVDRSQWPFIRYFLEKLVIPKAIEDWDLTAVYKGVKGSVTPGTPQLVANAVDGIRKQINDAITASDITPQALGAFPTDPVDVVDYLEAFAKGIEKKFIPYLQPIAISYSHWLLFRQGMRMKYNMNYDQADLTKIIDVGTPVVGLMSMEGDDKVWTTVKGNAIRAMKRGSDENIFLIERVDRNVKAYTDYWKACAFPIPQWVFTNDQDLS